MNHMLHLLNMGMYVLLQLIDNFYLHLKFKMVVLNYKLVIIQNYIEILILNINYYLFLDQILKLNHPYHNHLYQNYRKQLMVL